VLVDNPRCGASLRSALVKTHSDVELVAARWSQRGIDEGRRTPPIVVGFAVLIDAPRRGGAGAIGELLGTEFNPVRRDAGRVRNRDRRVSNSADGANPEFVVHSVIDASDFLPRGTSTTDSRNSRGATHFNAQRNHVSNAEGIHAQSGESCRGGAIDRPDGRYGARGTTGRGRCARSFSVGVVGVRRDGNRYVRRRGT
jgi:hypothetical protein